VATDTGEVDKWTLSEHAPALPTLQYDRSIPRIVVSGGAVGVLGGPRDIKRNHVDRPYRIYTPPKWLVRGRGIPSVAAT